MVSKKSVNRAGKKGQRRETAQGKKAKLFPSWIKVFVLGVFCGLSLQFIPGTETVTAEASSWFYKPYEIHCYAKDPSKYPSTNIVLEREGYTLAYDGRAKTALWVYEELTPDSIRGKSKEFSFRQDKELPPVIRSTNEDYRSIEKESGKNEFDKGHLAPRADFKSSETAMWESYYLSNVSPQYPKFNRGIWKNLEEHIRGLAERYGKVQVVTGPLYLSREEEEGKRYVKYQVIGKNEVAVPTHFFKVITLGEGDSKIQYAYVLPNDPNLQACKERGRGCFEEYLSSVEQVEKVLGHYFQIG